MGLSHVPRRNNIRLDLLGLVGAVLSKLGEFTGANLP